MAELPHLVKVANEFAAQGGRVLTISQDLFLPDVDDAKALAKVERLAERLGLTVPIYILRDDTLDPLNTRYDLPGPIPSTIAFDAQGREVDRQEGEADEERFRQMMRRALGLEPPAKR